MTKALLIIFIKNPVLGKTKTRLAATIGPEKALNIYLQLLERTQDITHSLPFAKALYYSDFIPEADNWETAVYAKHLQSGKNLGDRMWQAFQDGFSNHYKPICIIGSDCYELTPEIIKLAFHKLEDNDVVIGPSEDGGYYLLGMNQPQAFLFKDKTWSTENVLLETLRDVKEQGLSVALLPTLTDVDEEKDLHTLRKV